jgi:hypothetical protein
MKLSVYTYFYNFAFLQLTPLKFPKLLRREPPEGIFILGRYVTRGKLASTPQQPTVDLGRCCRRRPNPRGCCRDPMCNRETATFLTPRPPKPHPPPQQQRGTATRAPRPNVASGVSRNPGGKYPERHCFCRLKESNSRSG